MQNGDAVQERWDEETDVLVIGCGFAGAVTAIVAHDAGARVLIVEKMPDPGGISICSAGGLRIARDAEAAFRYLQATNAGTTPDGPLRALAQGMTEIEGFVRGLAEVNGASVSFREIPGNYPFPGQDTFGFVMIDDIPGVDVAKVYPHVRALGAGSRLFKVLHDNLAARGIAIRTDCPARRLLRGAEGVVGAVVGHDGATRRIRARRGVVLACGGFEANPAMQQHYWQGKPVLSTAFRGNTGDGIRMAQALGADLWHMWHYHGTYGFRHEGHPFGIRTKRLPDWFPRPGGEAEFNANFSGDRAVAMPWILLDRDGRRFMNEYEPYMQDTAHRPLERFRPETQDYPAIPCWFVADEEGRQRFPWGQPLYNDRGADMAWSKDNLAEIEKGIIGRAETVADLAAGIGVDAASLGATLDRWNQFCADGRDGDFLRPGSSMMPIATPPFYYATIWPLVSNTQGGPVHDERQRVLDPFGDPIPRLYSAGELGSVFGHLYMAGGNLAECFAGGRVAGREAASLEAQG